MIEYTEHFLQGLPQAPAYHPAEDGAALFENPISVKGMDLEKLLELLEDNVDNQGVNTPSPRHLAFIPGGALLALGKRVNGEQWTGEGKRLTTKNTKGTKKSDLGC